LQSLNPYSWLYPYSWLQGKGEGEVKRWGEGMIEQVVVGSMLAGLTAQEVEAELGLLEYNYNQK